MVFVFLKCRHKPITKSVTKDKAKTYLCTYLCMHKAVFDVF